MAGFCAACTSSSAERVVTARSSAAAPASVEAQLTAAVLAMERARSFAFDATIVGLRQRTELVGVFEAPDLEHVHIRGPGSTDLDVLFDGSRSWVRTPTGQWTNGLQVPGRSLDPRAAFDAVAAARDVRVVGATGTATTVRLEVPAAAARRLVAGAVLAPVQAEVSLMRGAITMLAFSVATSAGSLAVTVHYAEPNTAPLVTLPPGA
jgi:hypothetical protein